MRTDPYLGTPSTAPGERMPVNERRLFDVESATDRNSVSDLMFESKPPKWTRLVEPAPLVDGALPVDPEVRS